MQLEYLLLIALVVRVLLDLSGIVGSKWPLDGAYALLFLAAAAALLAKNRSDPFAYASAALSVAWGLKAVFAHKRQSAEQTAGQPPNENLGPYPSDA